MGGAYRLDVFELPCCRPCRGKSTCWIEDENRHNLVT